MQISYNKERGQVPVALSKSIRKMIYLEASPSEEIPIAAEQINEYQTETELKKELKRLKKEMEKAAKELDFMKAAELRDKLQSISNQSVKFKK